jgi:hypothetical protein
MHKWLVLFAIFFNFAVQPAAENVLFSNVNAVYKFGEQVTFQVSVSPASKVEHLYLFIQPEGKNARVETMQMNADGKGLFQYDASQFPLRPFARTYYWFRAVQLDNSEIDSNRYSFDYIDDRFTWRSLQNSSFVVNWYDADPSFGQDVMNAAAAGVESAKTFLETTSTDPIHIYVYSRSADLQKALQLTQQTWVAGHASPDIGVILVSVRPGPEQRMEMERQLPHEIAHLMEYNILGENYDRAPIWLLEGIASLAEIYPNPDYARVLENAKTKRNILPMSSLCSSFPREASGAFLAYAQSASFVRFLHDTYGTDGLQKLLKIYGDGVSCEEGTRNAFDIPLNQMDVRWRREALKMDMSVFALQNMLPYLLIALVILLSPIAMIIYTRRK